jgi:hypothetical protein
MNDRFRSQIREVINRNTVVTLALEQGFNAFLPTYDRGVDFILYRECDGLLRKVQLKGRWTIARQYIGRDIWIAFPNGQDWYLMPHDEMVSLAEAAGITRTHSWTGPAGAYSRPSSSAAVLAQCEPYRFRSISQVADEAAKDAQDDREE